MGKKFNRLEITIQRRPVIRGASLTIGNKMMKPRDSLKLVLVEAIELMRTISASHDAINREERDVAKKIAATECFDFNSLGVDELDQLINLLGYDWGYEEEKTEILIDYLLDLRNNKS